MTIIDSLILGILQGITEFLPISSSGHLVLAEHFMKLDVEAMKSFDIAVHFGTLLAILIYFRKDIIALIKGCLAYAGHKLKIKAFRYDAAESLSSAKMGGWLIAATIPAVLVGLFFEDFLDANFRNPFSVAVMMIIVGVLFFVAEFIASRRGDKQPSLRNAMLIGVAQACALVPGVSRSGATISAGIALGLKREEAARFSFLLGSIAIAAATSLHLVQALKGDVTIVSFDLVSAGVLSSFVAGYAAIAFLMRFLKKHTLHVFGIYRVLLGFALLYLS